MFVASTNSLHLDAVETVGSDTPLAVLLGAEASPRTVSIEGLVGLHQQASAYQIGDRVMHLPHVYIEM